MGFASYCRAVVRTAFKHSLTKAQDTIFVLLIAVGTLIYFVPQLKHKMPYDVSGWEMAAMVLGAIVLFRLAMAPYWIHQADQEHISKLRTTIETLGASKDNKPLTAEENRRLKLLSGLKLLYVRQHALELSAEFMSGLEDVPPEWVNEQLRQRGETWQWVPNKARKNAFDKEVLEQFSVQMMKGRDLMARLTNPDPAKGGIPPDEEINSWLSQTATLVRKHLGAVSFAMYDTPDGGAPVAHLENAAHNISWNGLRFRVQNLRTIIDELRKRG